MTVAAVAVDHSEVAKFVSHGTDVVRAVAFMECKVLVPASNTVGWVSSK